MSGLYLGAAAGLNIRRRIVHVHNADEYLPTPSRLKQALAREPLRLACLAMADRLVGVSDHTLDTFLAGRSRKPGRDRVHYCGIDPTPFAVSKGEGKVLRGELGVAADATLMLFGGRLDPEKNPVFTVDVLAALRRRIPGVIAVFSGYGSLEAAILDRARALDVQDSVRMLGWRNDMPRLMAACDLFILPHEERRMEGFGLAIIEAQLSGLPMLLSHGIPDDPLLPTAAYRRLGLSEGAGAWAAAGHDLLSAPPPDRAAAQTALAHSPMDMDRALDDLLALYQ
jgi:glycosyltransferase involved in cell wall biosynthesis